MFGAKLRLTGSWRAPFVNFFLVLVLNDKAADLGSERKSDPASLLHKNVALQHVHDM